MTEAERRVTRDAWDAIYNLIYQAKRRLQVLSEREQYHALSPSERRTKADCHQALEWWFYGRQDAQLASRERER